MNTIHHKAHILQILNHSLTDSLVAVAIIHSLPETYSTLKTILLSTPEDKLSSDAIINHILVEEKSQKSQSTSQTTFVAHLGKRKGKAQDKGKGEQGKGADGKPKLGKCAYCKKKMGIGQVKITMHQKAIYLVQNVYYIPDLNGNLLSVSYLVNCKYHVYFLL